ncbi:nudix hydrolase 20, chloroplastic-like [Cucurbita pepo subsp. pepo]|uniref:nudix hydrolase 20, chloroplastic-like n=1 Tax=Cucurbita pepo subsp. pepo TaxID=3664 RepID=UPI000C9D935F|nr:nudix hydrolase 20, chloroplastic-like [Cucurbita pepo subsp. pepo]XP_023530784.1 nudix hydrolase 20, chloroplastic-like [Cucurbita pepo subsp. pepo]
MVTCPRIQPMACKSLASHRFRNSLPISSISNASMFSRATYPTASTVHRSKTFACRSVSVASSNFTWEDAVHISLPESFQDDPSDLTGYFEKVKLCNRGSDMQSEFLPFVIDDQIVGHVHHGFAYHLKKYANVFTFPRDDSVRVGACLSLHESLKTPEDRTHAVGNVVKCLGEEIIPGIRNEMYPVTSSFGAPVFFSLERAAAPYFGIKVYGVQMNGYVEKDGKKFLWIAKRSQMKQTFPGMLDELVAGGLPEGVSCGENLMKECEEEAGIPRSISNKAIPVGAVSYSDIKDYSYKRDVLFCYDLKLPESFIPKNQDGEVEGFRLLPVTNVANVIRRTQLFKHNCALVIIDFLFRHGYIKPESLGYLELLQSLKSGTCF